MDQSTPVPFPRHFFPAELAGDTIEALYAMHGPERRWIYWLTLLGVIGALISLPLIHVDLTIRAPGMVRPVTERVELKVAVAGRIREVLVHDNDVVEAGQVLLILGSEELDERLRRQSEIQRERAGLLADLRTLLSGKYEAHELQMPAMRHELAQFHAQLDAYRLAETKAASEFTRYSTLSDKGIATRQELDNARYEVERLQAEARLFSEQTRALWATRLREEQSAQDDLASALRGMEEERRHYAVRSPAAGVLVGFDGLSPGGQLSAGQTLGAVSPGGQLQVETQVSTRNIGLVRVGQPVRLQVDAYPYTQWGMLEGTVEMIGGDLPMDDASGVPGYFKVRIHPAATYLSLPNGVRGELKKGLTLTARFVVARRSLLHVLYDDASAWLNPQDNRSLTYDGHP